MFEFITATENMAFSVALLVVLIIAALEGVGALFGAGLSNVLSSVLPDSDLPFGVDAPDLDSPSSLGRILSWLRVGQVPVLILLIVFLVSFGIGGLIIQQLAMGAFGSLLPGALASIPALALTFPAVRVFGGALNRIVPKDETSAVSPDSFVGRIAVLTLGQAERGCAAQAKVKDRHGQHHYIMVEPDNDGDVFQQGEKVLLVRRDSGSFFAIPNKNELLEDS